VPQDRLREQVELLVIGAADRTEVVVVAAVAEKVGNGLLQHDGRAQGVAELEAAHAFEVTAGRAPADAQRGREGLAERAAEEHATVGVPGLERLGAAFAEVQITVDVVLDGRHVELGEELVEFSFFRSGMHEPSGFW